MTEIDPATASHEAIRPHHAEHAAEQRRQEALRPERDGETTGTERIREERTEAAGNRDAESVRASDPVAVNASGPDSATGEVPRDREEARALAEETRERILDNPERAAESVRDTAHEPAASRMSRAIEALS
ncbi:MULTISPECIES: hypothetical protein [Halorhodospira]|uniref:hypothetical protein n=1 Tax=Halorhodospira TaxID=85108 RepID=UPI001EE8763E|nr:MULTISPECIES: hypothetical protein [Halorhodospira]MCG5528784.1 hypothetical protein [Halorhodospira halophila]MCG5533455.1 hypothetical protein [Halorhodospira sp. 9621]MCG5541133.1 hypothetical protein [Halorhodospira sp. M39old]MCG5543305.1 hypothetical protein [Halorhodospira sp. 9628]MCG5545584.1 hypothetical protein [Halorhodospira sp. M38]